MFNAWKKTGAVPSFRLRNKHPKDKPPAIRLGDNNRPARSRCPASRRSGRMTIPAGCGASSKRIDRTRQPGCARFAAPLTAI
jgi:hypothetical protein